MTTAPTRTVGSADDVLELPLAQPATPDLVCWLWALAGKSGRINVNVVARTLSVSPATVRRWLRQPEEWQLQQGALAILRQHAILKGRGTYLWPDLDQTTINRGRGQLAAAIDNLTLLRETPTKLPPTWRTTGVFAQHMVHVLHYPHAHVYGIAITSSPKTLARLNSKHPDFLASRTVSNKWEAWYLKHKTLERVAERRCIAPASMVPIGRTETVREAGGVLKLASLPRHDRPIR